MNRRDSNALSPGLLFFFLPEALEARAEQLLAVRSHQKHRRDLNEAMSFGSRHAALCSRVCSFCVGTRKLLNYLASLN